MSNPPTETSEEIDERLTTYRRRADLVQEKLTREAARVGASNVSPDLWREWQEANEAVQVAFAEWMTAKAQELLERWGV